MEMRSSQELAAEECADSIGPASVPIYACPMDTSSPQARSIAMAEGRFCSYCNEPLGPGKLLRCSRCRSAFYCNREHQRSHWAAHKLYKCAGSAHTCVVCGVPATKSCGRCKSETVHYCGVEHQMLDYVRQHHKVCVFKEDEVANTLEQPTCAVCLEDCDCWLGRRNFCCGALVCWPCMLQLCQTPGQGGLTQAERCVLCRALMPRTEQPGERQEKLQKSREWADKGRVWALGMIADMHYYGEDGQQVDRPLAMAMYERAAEQGDAGTLTRLGCMYSSGVDEVDADIAKATGYYQRAAVQGDPTAMLNLASRVFTDCDTHEAQVGAVTLWRRVSDAYAGCHPLGSVPCQKIVAQAQYELARRLLKGQGCEMSEEQATFFLGMAVHYNEDARPIWADTQKCCFYCSNREGDKMSCSRCKCAVYCSRVCQKKAYKYHKRHCARVVALRSEYAGNAELSCGDRLQIAQHRKYRPDGGWVTEE